MFPLRDCSVSIRFLRPRVFGARYPSFTNFSGPVSEFLVAAPSIHRRRIAADNAGHAFSAKPISMALRALAAAADPPGCISNRTCAFNRVCILVSA
jgi:hypothetical protein